MYFTVVLFLKLTLSFFFYFHNFLLEDTSFFNFFYLATVGMQSHIGYY